MQNNKNLIKKEFLIYTDENGDVIGHRNNIFTEGELDEKSNVEKIDIAGSDKPVKIYNLNVIIAVGYRVNSKKQHNLEFGLRKF